MQKRDRWRVCLPCSPKLVAVIHCVALPWACDFSYRRGKPQSNDVDIVITHTDWNLGSQKVKGLCRKLVQRLHEQGQRSAVEILGRDTDQLQASLRMSCVCLQRDRLGLSDLTIV